MLASSIENRIKVALIDYLQVDLEPAAIPDDTPLIGRGLGLDSVSILQLVGSIEKTFQIEIPDEEITRELFSDVSTLAEYVRRKADEARTGSARSARTG